MPLGGLDAGHKGFGLGLLIEAMTGALADTAAPIGRRLGSDGVHPGGRSGSLRRAAAFKRQMDHLADAAHASKPRAGGERVRLPGERGLQRYREAVANGVALYPAILPALEPWAQKYGVAPPLPSN